MFPVPKLFSWLCKAVGWSPIGKKVIIKIDDCKYSPMFGQEFAGKIKTVIGSTTEEDDQAWALILLDEPMVVEKKPYKHVWVSPRHEGYGFSVLCYTWIGASLAVCDSCEQKTLPALLDEIAICSIKVKRGAR